MTAADRGRPSSMRRSAAVQGMVTIGAGLPPRFALPCRRVKKRAVVVRPGETENVALPLPGM